MAAQCTPSLPPSDYYRPQPRFWLQSVFAMGLGRTATPGLRSNHKVAPVNRWRIPRKAVESLRCECRTWSAALAVGLEYVTVPQNAAPGADDQ